jgi:hypothetical protein
MSMHRTKKRNRKDLSRYLPWIRAICWLFPRNRIYYHRPLLASINQLSEEPSGLRYEGEVRVNALRQDRKKISWCNFNSSRWHPTLDLQGMTLFECPCSNIGLMLIMLGMN